MSEATNCIVQQLTWDVHELLVKICAIRSKEFDLSNKVLKAVLGAGIAQALNS
jgi:hypothetical protein